MDIENGEDGTHILDFVDEVLESKGLSMGDEGSAKIAEEVLHKWVVAEESQRVSSLYYEMLSLFNLVRLYNQVLDGYYSEYDDIEEMSFSESMFDDAFMSKSELAEKWGRVEVAEDLVLYFTLSNEKIAQLSRIIFEESIIDDEFKGTSKTEKCIDSLSQREREQLLLRSGTISSGLHSKMTDTRDIRNSLAHDLEMRYYGNTERDVEKDLRRSLECIDELYEKTTEYDMLSGIMSSSTN